MIQTYSSSFRRIPPGSPARMSTYPVLSRQVQPAIEFRDDQLVDTAILYVLFSPEMRYSPHSPDLPISSLGQMLQPDAQAVVSSFLIDDSIGKMLPAKSLFDAIG